MRSPDFSMQSSTEEVLEREESRVQIETEFKLGLPTTAERKENGVLRCISEFFPSTEEQYFRLISYPDHPGMYSIDYKPSATVKEEMYGYIGANLVRSNLGFILIGRRIESNVTERCMLDRIKGTFTRERS